MIELEEEKEEKPKVSKREQGFINTYGPNWREVLGYDDHTAKVALDDKGAPGSLLGDAVTLGLSAWAVKNPLKAIEALGADPDDFSLEVATQKASLNPANLTIGKVQRLKKGVERIAETADTLIFGPKYKLAYETVNVDDGLLKGVTNSIVEVGFKSENVFAFKRAARTAEVKQRIAESEIFRPKQVKKQTWGNYIEKFGDKDSSLAAVKKAEESAAYLKKHGTLKGNKNTWTAPNGEVYYINNKTSRAQKARGEVNIGFDNLKSIQKTLEARSAGAKLNEKLIYELAETMPGWDKAKAARYIEESKQAKRTLENLIKDLNKGEGRTMWSLGHRTAVKELPHSADRALNIELEPLIDVLTKEGRKIKGNTGRAANDELGEILSRITNNPTDLKADMLHWGDDVIGNFMPRMREITDAKTFFEEIVKREDFIAKAKALAKKEGISLQDAAHDIMKPLMDKTPVSQPPYFE